MKFIFIVQGEGRGHLTQAISLYKLLKKNRHEVAKIFVGSSQNKVLPAFFINEINTEIIQFESPTLKYQPKSNRLSLSKTIFNGIVHCSTFIKSIKTIRQEIEKTDADIIINFYDVLGGLYNFFSNKTQIPFICIAHQYLLLDKSFPHPKKHFFEKHLVNLNTKLTALKATKLLALSFREIETTYPNLKVVPPLIRAEIHELQPDTQDFLLVYVSQHGLAEKIIHWHEKNPRVMIHCFWDKPQTNEVVRHSNNLYFHRINGEKFLDMMKSCKGLITTAGFESVCEAMFLKKPVMMIPMPKHYEQVCNAIDGEISGAGIKNNSFEIDTFIDYIPTYNADKHNFSHWQLKYESIFLNAFEEIAQEKQQNFSINKSAPKPRFGSLSFE